MPSVSVGTTVRNRWYRDAAENCSNPANSRSRSPGAPPARTTAGVPSRSTAATGGLASGGRAGGTASTPPIVLRPGGEDAAAGYDVVIDGVPRAVSYTHLTLPTKRIV